MRSNLDRAKYYKYIQGDMPAAEIEYYSNSLTFVASFKYARKEDAENVLTTLCGKFKKDNLTAADFRNQFEIKEYEDMPFEYVDLHIPQRNDLIKIKLAQDDKEKNWQCTSRIYCNKCGVYIPADQPRLAIQQYHLCWFCIDELNAAMQKSVTLSEEKKKQLETARVVGMF